MKLNIFFALFASLALFLSCYPSSKAIQETQEARFSKWELLGEKMVNKRGDRDEMNVRARRGTFRKIKFVSRRAPIHLHKIKIVYGNGSSTNIIVNKRIPKGTASPVFDLPGDRRIIKKVIFHYKTVASSPDRALVRVWAK